MVCIRSFRGNCVKIISRANDLFSELITLKANLVCKLALDFNYLFPIFSRDSLQKIYLIDLLVSAGATVPIYWTVCLQQAGVTLEMLALLGGCDLQACFGFCVLFSCFIMILFHFYYN